ncbi:hypothetical protein EDC02_6305 [Micromonospora sp. Llam0]|nr:hypothetical protein EDC02_6305 [Micromonospora sp. Llam0]
MELGLSVSKAAERAGGIARNTWTGIETGKTRTQARHHAGIERALRWRQGSIEKVLAGDAPMPHDETEARSQPADQGIDVQREIDRIYALNLPARVKIDLIGKILDLHDEVVAEQRPA